MTEQKRRWATPAVQSFGTFEAATRACDKTLGSTDGFTFQGQAEACGGVASPFLLGLTDETGIDDFDLIVLAVGRVIQVFES